MTTFYKQEWAYDTSEDKTTSLLVASYSRGTIVLKKDGSDAKMNIKYKCIAAGSTQGPDLNGKFKGLLEHVNDITESSSTFDSPSCGTNVYSTKFFDELCFPCHGWIASLGAAFGNGKQANIILFGSIPFFAWMKSWGDFKSSAISAGTSWGMAGFSLDDW